MHGVRCRRSAGTKVITNEIPHVALPARKVQEHVRMNIITDLQPWTWSLFKTIDELLFKLFICHCFAVFSLSQNVQKDTDLFISMKGPSGREKFSLVAAKSNIPWDHLGVYDATMSVLCNDGALHNAMLTSLVDPVGMTFMPKNILVTHNCCQELGKV